RLNTGVTLRDVDDVAVDVVDGASDKLPEIRSQDQGAGRRVRVLDGSDLFVELIDDDVGMQIGEIVDLRRCRAQHLLYADNVGDDQVDLIRADATDLACRCVVEQVRCCQGHVTSSFSSLFSRHRPTDFTKINL